MIRRTHIFIIMCLLPAVALAQTAEWKLMHEGNRHFRNGAYDAAEKCYLAAQKRKPNDARAAFNLGDTYLAKRDVQSAMKQYETAVRNEKNRVVRGMAHHNMGFIAQTAALGASDEQQKQQRLTEAIGHYKDALRCNPRDEDARYNLALCQKQLKKGDEKNNQQQQQPKQQPKPQSKDKSDENRSPQRRQQQQPQKQDPQVQQLLNLSRQAEQRTKEKVNNAQPRRQTLDKNW